MIKVAVDGTLAVLKASTAAGVKRVVVTSSFAAIYWQADKDLPRAGKKLDETYWSNPNRERGMTPYSISKTLAERAAWEY